MLHNFFGGKYGSVNWVVTVKLSFKQCLLLLLLLIIVIILIGILLLVGALRLTFLVLVSEGGFGVGCLLYRW
jgi:hypothetical protein